MAPIFAGATANEAPRMGEMNSRLPWPMSTAHLLGCLRAAMLAAFSESWRWMRNSHLSNAHMKAV